MNIKISTYFDFTRVFFLGHIIINKHKNQVRLLFSPLPLLEIKTVPPPICTARVIMLGAPVPWVTWQLTAECRWIGVGRSLRLQSLTGDGVWRSTAFAGGGEHRVYLGDENSSNAPLMDRTFTSIRVGGQMCSRDLGVGRVVRESDGLVDVTQSSLLFLGTTDTLHSLSLPMFSPLSTEKSPSIKFFLL